MAIWVFFTSHYIWFTRLSQAIGHGAPIPKRVVAASKALCMVAMFNLLLFFVVYGWKVSWLWAFAIVLGSYFATLIYAFVFREKLSILAHKIGWIGIPALSVAIWPVAFSA